MNEKRGPAAEKKRKAQMDQRYQNIMRRFGSIEAYEQARQEGKFYKPPPIVEKPKIRKMKNTMLKRLKYFSMTTLMGGPNL